VALPALLAGDASFGPGLPGGQTQPRDVGALETDALEADARQAAGMLAAGR
jgi:hypothetical protein